MTPNRKGWSGRGYFAALAGITFAGALPRAWQLGAQPGFAWDEAYYVPAARAYLDGDLAQNAEHPPLGKWAIAAGIELAGDDPVGWRLAALVAGIVTVPLTWLLVRRLLGSAGWATAAAVLVAADGLLIVHSRVALLDGLLPPLLLGAALCITTSIDRHGRRVLSPWLLGAGALLGAAVAVKWQAAPVLAGVLLAFVVPGRADRRALVTAMAAFVAVPAVVYVASYAGHFADGLTPAAWVRLQGDMVDYHRHFRVDHRYDSSPASWLLLQRPVYFGADDAGGRTAVTLALGNPALWWSFVACLPVLVVAWWRGRDRTVDVVLLGWATLHLSWLIVLRPGFLYYLAPLVPFMAVGVVWTLREAVQRWPGPGRLLTGVVLLGAVVAFVLYLPLWTFQDSSDDRFRSLLLLDSWEP